MSPVHEPSVNHDTRFPRVSGDEPGIDTDVENIKAFSPRERG